MCEGAQPTACACPCGGRLRAPSPLSPRRVRRAGGTILSMPRGPSDVRTASATALAATMLLSRTLPGAQTKSDSWGVATPEASGGRAEPQLAGEGEAACKASAGWRRSGVLRPEPPARCDQSAPGLAWALPVRSRVQCAQVASAGAHLFSCARSAVLCSFWGAAGADMLRRCAASPAAKRPLRMLRRGAPRRRLAPLFPPLHPSLPFRF